MNLPGNWTEAAAERNQQLLAAASLGKAIQDKWEKTCNFTERHEMAVQTYNSFTWERLKLLFGWRSHSLLSWVPVRYKMAHFLWLTAALHLQCCVYINNSNNNELDI